METTTTATCRRTAWNKGKLIGQKSPLKLKEIWATRIRLQLERRTRELALFNLAIDSKLRGCDLVSLRVHDVTQGTRVTSRAIVMQKKTQRPVQFELTEQTRLRATEDPDPPDPASLSEALPRLATALDDAAEQAGWGTRPSLVRVTSEHSASPACSIRKRESLSPSLPPIRVTQPICWPRLDA